MKKQQALQVLFQNDDYDSEKLSFILENTVESLGVLLKFVPKYHPGFHFIEMYLGYVKLKVSNECDYKWQTFLEHIPEDLDYVFLIFMSRAFTICCRYIEEYRVVLTPDQVKFASKKYNIHHRLPLEFLNK